MTNFCSSSTEGHKCNGLGHPPWPGSFDFISRIGSTSHPIWDDFGRAMSGQAIFIENRRQSVLSTSVLGRHDLPIINSQGMAASGE
ncbi:unnamed protein product [Protopolystoma xenopodis]|uniref:Uncharacterized protein n=1 Tax=Protopolystoma xenopodis TaxID=117903 RepID=A0A3S5AGK8_9PLAT|nr:unnamed protein product [Protopolystoma xenopodis]